ncbi:hypothetical protein OROGR_024101 [Orobanche gracilis]
MSILNILMHILVYRQSLEDIIMPEPEADAEPWSFLNINNIFSNNYYGDTSLYDVNICHKQYIADNNCPNIENDEIIARSLLDDELFQLSIAESPELSDSVEEGILAKFHYCLEGGSYGNDDEASLCSSLWIDHVDGDDYCYTLPRWTPATSRFFPRTNSRKEYGVKILVVTSFKDTCYIEILPKDKQSKRV